MREASFHNPLSPYQRLVQRFLMRVRPAPLAVALKRGLGVHRVPAETPHGSFTFDPVSPLGQALCDHGEYEPGMRHNMERTLQQGSTFVDVGANEGYFSVIAGRLVGTSGRVLAIEPQARLLPVIADNLARNNLHNVTVLNVAIGSPKGDQKLYLTSDTNSGGSGLHRSERWAWGTQQVTVRRLEDVLDEQHINQVDFMKVDIEGSEYEAILSSLAVFTRHRVKVLGMELHPSLLAARGKDAADIVRALAESGYRMADMKGHTVWTIDGRT
jgi:FkbM family methyltransferase